VRLADLLSTTSSLRLGGILALSVAIAVFAWGIAADPSGLAYRYSARYVSALERKLRPMFIFTPGAWIAWGQVGAAFVVIAAHILVTIDFWWAIVIAIAAGPMLYIDSLRKKRIEAVEMQLDGFLIALANSLKATPSIGAAFGSVADVITEPMKSEVELAIKEMKVGSTLDQALLSMAGRVGSRQLESALSSILIGRQVGGNLPKVLETTANTLREMRRLEGVVKTKTAEGKAQLWVIAMLPFGMLVGLNLMFPGYFVPLTTNITGYIIIAGCAGAWVTSIVLARKILNVDI
jgi:tight adherence protein B